MVEGFCVRFVKSLARSSAELIIDTYSAQKGRPFRIHCITGKIGSGFNMNH